MDIFDHNRGLPDFHQEERNIHNTPFFPIPSQKFHLAERRSVVEQVIDTASGSLRRTIKLIMLVAGLFGVLALSCPYLRFVFRFADWLDGLIKNLF